MKYYLYHEEINEKYEISVRIFKIIFIKKHVTLRLCHNTLSWYNIHKFYATTYTYPEESRKLVRYFLHFLSEINLIGTKYILSLILSALKIISKLKSVLPTNLKKKSNMLQKKIFRLNLIKSIRRRNKLVVICIFFLQIYIYFNYI